MITGNTSPLPSAAELATATGKTPDRATAWLKRLSEVEAHVAAHGRFPRARWGGRAEGSLYDWVKYQKGEMTAELARHILDERLPGWDSPRAAEKVRYEDWVLKLKIHRDAYGAWPSSRARDPQVAPLWRWLNNQRVMWSAGKLAPARKALLDNQVPGWNETVQETWERTVQEIATFRSLNGRLPAYSSKEHSERRLSRWLGDFRQGRNLTPERKAYLDEHLPGWSLDGRLRSSKAAHRQAAA